jgi:FkbM family methyltransferase
MHNPDTCGSEEFMVDFFGSKYRGNFDTFIDWSVFYYGAYSREELRLIDDFLQTINDPVFVDVGANIGHHTLFAATRAKKVLAFEPFAEVAKKLKQKVSDNGLTNVVLFEYALGERNENATYSKPGTHNTGTGSFAKQEGPSETLTLPIKIGDEVLALNDLTDIHFIKIDTEGFEPFVLKGLKRSLEHSRPLVFFEWTQVEREKTHLAPTDLFPNNYSIYNFIPDTVVLGLLREPTYRLSLLSDTWPDGNLFALPNEYVERLKAEKPLSTAAKRLGFEKSSP